jgi:hypothetical protein
MLLTVLFSLATIAAVVGGFAGLIYPFKCWSLERHLDSTAPEYVEDEQGNEAWYQKRYAKDKTRKRTALYALGAYLVGMFSLIPVNSMLKAVGSTSHAPMIIMLVLTAGLLIVGLCSAIHNDSAYKLDMKRRYPWGLQ